MNLGDFKKVNYSKYRDTALFSSFVKIQTFNGQRPIFDGTISELCQNEAIENDWIIVEILVDYSRQHESNLPDYNKSKIVRVM